MVKTKNKRDVCNNDRLLSASIPPKQLEKLRQKSLGERNKIIQDKLNECERKRRSR